MITNRQALLLSIIFAGLVAFMAATVLIVQLMNFSQNRAIVFAACRAYHRRDLLEAKAANDRVAIETKWLSRHPGLTLARASLPVDMERLRSAQFILHFDCMSGMMSAERESRAR